MEGLKAWEALRGLEEGKELEFKTASKKWRDFEGWNIAGIIDGVLNKGWEVRLKQEEGRTVEAFGRVTSLGLWAIEEGNELLGDTHKITFKEDKEGNLICESIKMEKL